MRPTKLNFRSPKERTGEIIYPMMKYDGTSLDITQYHNQSIKKKGRPPKMLGLVLMILKDSNQSQKELIVLGELQAFNVYFLQKVPLIGVPKQKDYGFTFIGDSIVQDDSLVSLSHKGSIRKLCSNPSHYNKDLASQNLNQTFDSRDMNRINHHRRIYSIRQVKEQIQSPVMKQRREQLSSAKRSQRAHQTIRSNMSSNEVIKEECPEYETTQKFTNNSPIKMRVVQKKHKKLRPYSCKNKNKLGSSTVISQRSTQYSNDFQSRKGENKENIKTCSPQYLPSGLSVDIREKALKQESAQIDTNENQNQLECVEQNPQAQTIDHVNQGSPTIQRVKKPRKLKKIPKSSKQNMVLATSSTKKLIISPYQDAEFKKLMKKQLRLKKKTNHTVYY